MQSERTGWRAIRDDLTGRIAAGEWRPGEVIPPEIALAESYGCSRATVNRALSEMAASGAVERRRRVGTRVAIHGASAAKLAIPLVREQVESRGALYSYRMIGASRDWRALDLPPDLVAPEDVAALYLVCLHLADGAPFQLESRWVNLSVAPEAAAQDFARRSPNEWLVRETPWSRIAHLFRADQPQGREQSLLALNGAEPVFVIERSTWLGDAPITRTRLAHPGFSFVMETES